MNTEEFNKRKRDIDNNANHGAYFLQVIREMDDVIRQEVIKECERKRANGMLLLAKRVTPKQLRELGIEDKEINQARRLARESTVEFMERVATTIRNVFKALQ